MTFTLFMALMLPAPVLAIEAAPLFDNNWVIEATLDAPLGRMMRSRDEDEELEGEFTYLDPNGQQRTLSVKVRVRGRFRARKNVCDFAPLRLNFKEKQVIGTEFEGQDKLKLVTHCQNKDRAYEQLMLKEFLTYQFLAEITDNAFRSRLLKITYIDSEGKSSTRIRYAFLIEHRKKLAARIHSKPGESKAMAPGQLDDAQTNLVAVYSYFIGNTDYSAVQGPKADRCCHNVELFENQAGHFLPIPYDFDFSGIVNAPYALPNPRFTIRKVTDRLYRGLCKNVGLLGSTFALFAEHRPAINAMIDSFEPLNGVSRKQMMRYIDRFYREIGNEGKVEKNFVKECSAAIVQPNSNLATRR